MAVLSNNVIAGASIADDGAGDGAYQIERSLRFNVGDEPRLTRTFGSAGNKRASTLSFWCKPSSMTGSQGYHIFGTNVSNDTQTMITYFYGGTSPVFKVSGWNTIWKVPTQVFRDPSAWYHFVVTIDTSNATADDRIRVYINGKRVTDFSTSNNPSQHAELGWGHAAAYGIGVRPDDYTQGWFNGYLADLQFIDGLALGPAAFGQFSSDGSGVWNPKAFALPAPNDGTTWSSSLTSTGAFDDAATQAFNGLTSNGAKPDDNCTATFQPSSAISCSSEIRLHFSISGSGVAGDDVTINDIHKGPGIAAGWNTFNDIRSLEKITWKHRSGVIGFTLNAIEVDGVMLIDGKTDLTTRTNPNDGTSWSDLGTASGTPYTSGNSHTAVFDGSEGSQFFAADQSSSPWYPATAGFTLGTSISNYTKLEMYISGPHNNLTTGFKLNGVDKTSAVIAAHGNGGVGWVDIGASAFLNGAALESFEIYSTAGNTYVGIHGIRVDGHVLIDNTVDNSYHLKFNDTSTNARLGRNSFNTDVTTATGALPIYNTTAGSDGYDNGETKGSGYRTDSSAGTTDGTGLVLAVPGDSVASGTCDVHQQINIGSSNKAISSTGGDPAVVTSDSRFYGSSIEFDGNDQISFSNSDDFDFGSGNFTIEAWVNTSDTSTNYPSIFGCWHTNTAKFDFRPRGTDQSGEFYWIHRISSSNTIIRGKRVITDGTWHHIAVSRQGNVFRMFCDGQLTNSETHAHTLDDSSGMTINVGYDEWGASYYTGKLNDLRVYKGVAKYTTNFTPPTRNDFKVNNLTHDDGSTEAVSIANATGALPVMKTTDTYGQSMGVGARDDDDYSNLVLAVPMKDDAVEVSSNGHTLGVVGATLSSDQSMFYGDQSYKFTGSSNHSLTLPSSTYGTDLNFGTGSACIEMWVYNTSTANTTRMLANCYAGNYSFQIFGGGGGSNTIYGAQIKDGGNNWRDVMSTTSYADTLNKWTHMAFVIDGSADKLKFYVNGTLEGTADYDGTIKDSNVEFNCGRRSGTNDYGWEGYIQDLRIYKGTTKYTGDFTVPRPLTQVQDAAKLDVLTDTPTNYGTDTGAGGEVRGNYATWNPLIAAGTTFSQGNLRMSWSSEGTRRWNTSTIAVRPGDGRFLVEHTLGGGMADEFNCGFMKTSDLGFYTADGGAAYSYWWRKTGEWYNGTTVDNSKSVSAWTTGDVLGVAIDYSGATGSIYLYKNGTAENSGNAVKTGLTDELAFLYTGYDSSSVDSNFGQRAYKHPVTISGQKFGAVCTQNLPDLFSGDELNNPSKYFDVTTYTGTGDSDNQVRGLNFTPDLVWIKNRNSASNYHEVFDQIRGVTKPIYTNLNATQGDYSGTDNSLRSFDSGGFTVNDDASGSYGVNGPPSGTYSGNGTFVGWAWDAGTAGAANDEGSTDIASPNQWKNATAGFSITKYTGNGASRTIGHGLGAKPDFWITKDLDEARTHAWRVWHTGLSGMNYRLELDESDAEATSSTSWDNTAPTNSVFSLGADDNTNKNGNDYIIYCWTAIPGYSAFGSYSGNSSTNGTFIYTGFRVKYVLIKRTDSTSPWTIFDSARGKNENNVVLEADTSSAEDTPANRQVDLLSNGFKNRATSSNTNATGGTYIYAAFAESPQKIARAV